MNEPGQQAVSKTGSASVVARIAVIPLILLFIYVVPRVLVSRLGAADPWTSYLYQYGMGLIVFLVGLWIILATGACKPGRGHDTFWLGVLIGGFIFFASVHALWILAALKLPFYGG